MDFKKYMHVEKLGNTEVEGILEGACYVFPKLDGTNGSLWWTKNGLKAGSRNRELSVDNDNADFYKTMLKDEKIETFFKENPSLRLFGEWLVPHSLKTYREDSWKRFYIFDVMDVDDNYLSYNTYQPLLEKHGLDYVPPLFFVENPTEERIKNSLEQNIFLIDEDKGFGEGIVVKNYSFRNKFGRICWAKVTTNGFKEAHSKNIPRKSIEKNSIEDKIIEDFVTEHLINKVYSKIVNAEGGWSSKNVPRLLNTVYYDLVKEEMWEIQKKYKKPTISFSVLYGKTVSKVKKVLPEVF
jgi:hypothetical protein